jgi:LPS sulfotransferase NodH
MIDTDRITDPSNDRGKSSAELYILLAEQRSGTAFLKSMLSNAPGIATTGEICNPDLANRKSPASFLKFRANASIADEKFFYPTTEVQTELLDNYFNFVRSSLSHARHVVLDVKYSHVYNFHPCWWSVGSRPFLLDYAIRRRIRFIHLVREKPYQTAISNFYALGAKVWHVRNGEAVPSTKIKVDRTELQRRAADVANTVGLFTGWLNGAKQIRISYEALAEQTERTLAVLRDFCGLNVDIPAQSEYVKSTPPYEQVIENFGEIADLMDLDLQSVIAKVGGIH